MPAPMGVSHNRWTPEIEVRARALWPEVVAVSRLEAQDPVLATAVIVWESGVRNIRGGLGNTMWGVGQVHCATWLESLRARYAPGLVCEDLLTPTWGIVSTVHALRMTAAMAGDSRMPTLCAYAHGMSGLTMTVCEYALGVNLIEALIRRDLCDLVEQLS